MKLDFSSLPSERKNWAEATVGIQVLREDSEYFERRYRVFYIRQKDFEVQQWIYSIVDSLSCLGGVPGDQTMKEGESRRYFCKVLLRAYQDYLGDWDDDIEFLKVKRSK